MTLSQLALEDVEALCFEPSFLTADPMGPLLDQDEEEEALSPSSSSSSLQGKALASSPSSSSSSSSSSIASSLSPYQVMSFSPPHDQSSSSPTLQSLPWLVPDDLLHSGVGDGNADDAFAGMDWMSEKIDLSEFDLDSLMGSSPGSPEDLLASLDSQMDLGLDSLELSLSLPAVPSLHLEPQTTMKSEPPSPAPADMLELGSEVDVLEAEKTAPPASLPAPIVLSVVPPAHFLVVPVPDCSQKTSSDCDSDSGIESVASSPPRQLSPPPPASSSRTKPYFKPSPSPVPRTPKMKSAPRVVEKKLKKMEQNKTAATRYRQKKRVEQELLVTECQELEDRNRQLAEKAESISREIQYLKDLMEEVRKHRRGKTGSAA